MPSRHALKTRQVEPDDGFLRVADDRHTHLTRAAHDFFGRAPVLRHVNFLIRNTLLAKELHRSVTPWSSRCAVDSDRVSTSVIGAPGCQMSDVVVLLTES